MPNDTQVKIDLLPDDPESLVVESFEIKNDTLEIRWADGQIETTHNLPTLLGSAYDSATRRQRNPLLCCGIPAIREKFRFTCFQT